MSVSGNRFWFSHQREMLLPAVIMLAIIVCGVVAGGLSVQRLPAASVTQLNHWLTDYLSGVSATPHTSLAAWSSVLKVQSISLLLCWFLGLTVLGIPLIVILIGARGFILGFTVGFLVKEHAARGLLLALVGVLPQNLCYIPALVIAGSLACYFSSSLLRGVREHSVTSGLLAYTLAFLAIMLVVLLGTWIEAYLSPGLLRLVTTLLT
jgi:stage II sporulation protein M